MPTETRSVPVSAPLLKVRTRYPAHTSRSGSASTRARSAARSEAWACTRLPAQGGRCSAATAAQSRSSGADAASMRDAVLHSPSAARPVASAAPRRAPARPGRSRELVSQSIPEHLQPEHAVLTGGTRLVARPRRREQLLGAREVCLRHRLQQAGPRQQPPAPPHRDLQPERGLLSVLHHRVGVRVRHLPGQAAPPRWSQPLLRPELQPRHAVSPTARSSTPGAATAPSTPSGPTQAPAVSARPERRLAERSASSVGLRIQGVSHELIDDVIAGCRAGAREGGEREPGEHTPAGHGEGAVHGGSPAGRREGCRGTPHPP